MKAWLKQLLSDEDRARAAILAISLAGGLAGFGLVMLGLALSY